METKNKSKNNERLLMVAVATITVLLSIPFTPWHEAFAVSYLSVTTTGTQSNDNCISTTDDIAQVWLLCNSSTVGANSILSMTDGTGHQKGQITTGVTYSNAIKIMPAFGNSQTVIIVTSSVFVKYNWNGSGISFAGQLNPPSCTNALKGVGNYDTNGLLWYSCPTQNKIGVMNPATMTNVFQSSALGLTGTASSCNNTPQDVQTFYPKTTVAIMVVQCTNPQEMYIINATYNSATIAFTQSTGSLSVGDNSNLPDIYLDPISKRIITQDVNGGLGLDTFTYTLNAGNNFITAVNSENTHFGSAVNSMCQSDFYLSNALKGHILICQSTNQIQGFYSNQTLFVQTFNLGSYVTTYSSSVRPVGTYDASVFVVSTGILDSGTQTFLYITGTATLYGAPSSNSPPGSNSGTPVTECWDISSPGGALNKVCITCPGALGTTQAISASCPNGYPNPVTSTNNPAPFKGFYNGSQSLGIYGCATGFFSCSNEAPASNGLGYALLAGLIVVSAMALMYATYKTQHSPQDVVLPVALVSILESGAFWQMGLTTSIPFFVGILGIIGLGSFKIYGMIAK